MKVCHVGTEHRRYDTRIFYKECVSLAKAGYNVTFLIADDCLPEETRNGVRILPVHGVPRSRFMKRFFKYNEVMLKKALELDADVYHLHEWELLPWAKQLKNRNKTVVFDSHEYYSMNIKGNQSNPIQRNLILFLYNYCESFIREFVDALIFPCNKDGVHPFEGRCKRLITLDNYPSLDMYKQYIPNIKKKERSICYVGGLSEARGITEVVKAAGLSDTTVYLAGSFSPPSYRRRIEELAEFSSVKYLGLLNRDEIIKLLQSCQIGMATIHCLGQYGQFDNLATKCYEYMSLGLPVILTKAKYSKQVNDKYRFGICVDAENELEIASAIQYLLEHEEEAKQMGLNGRKAIFEEFNWEKEQMKLLDLYTELGEE